MTAAGIIGYGRFGRTLAQLAQRAGLPVRVFDVEKEVPSALQADSLEALARACELMWIATPVTELRAVLVALAPHLGPKHVVADVCSVKVEPTRVLSQVLGTKIPWVATHPLFGPDSVAEDSPLRVVVCPSLEHPAAVARVRNWVEALGCEVLERSAESHDELMARTQALAFFLGRGLQLASLGADEALTSSSLAARDLARAAATEAPHLIETILSMNPYAGATRATLLEKLEALDARAATQETSATPAEVLAAARERIDTLDRRLLVVLQRRAELMRQVSEAKRALGRPVKDPEREAAVFESRRVWADEMHLDRAFVDAVFRAILEFSRWQQEKGRTAG